MKSLVSERIVWTFVVLPLGALLLGLLAGEWITPVASAGAAAGIAPTAVSVELQDAGSETYQRYLVYDEAYYSKVDPSRIYVDRPARSDERRARLLPLSPVCGEGRPLQVHAGPLAVRTSPGAPVTFYAPDQGRFPNGECSITVRADDEGRAETSFTYGTMSSFHRVVAHSPEAVGWVVFQLEALSDAAWDRLASQRGGY